MTASKWTSIGRYELIRTLLVSSRVDVELNILDAHISQVSNRVPRIAGNRYLCDIIICEAGTMSCPANQTVVSDYRGPMSGIATNLL